MPDSNTIAGISYYALGMSLLVPLYAFAAWIVWSDRSPHRLLLASFITIFGFFVLAPRMHERYIYPAIVLAAPLALEAPLMTAMFVILSFTGLINIAYVLRTLQSPIHPPGTVAVLEPHDGIAMAVSVLNLVVLAVAVYYGAAARLASSGGARKPVQRALMRVRALQTDNARTPIASSPFVSSVWVERGLIFICLVAIAARFYPTAGRFIDKDELYFFYLSHAVSRGGQLYSGLKTYYAPGSFYIGAAVFTLFRDLYAGLLAARIFVITLGLLGFLLVFDIFRRLRLTWFILPVTFFVLFLTQFDLKLMEFRPDNIVLPVVVASNSGCFFQLNNEGTTRQDLKLLAIVLLGLLSVHVGQKAMFAEAAISMALAITQSAALAALLRRRWFVLSLSILLVAATAAWSSSYRRFVFEAYIDPLDLMRLDNKLVVSGRLAFMWGCLNRNVSFWFLTALAVIFLVRGLSLNPRRYLAPLLLLLAASALLYSSPFPYLQYQLYLTWAALLALPFAVRVACDLFSGAAPAVFTVCVLAAFSSLFTCEFFRFRYQSLHEYAIMIDGARRAIGKEPVAFAGGTLISANSVFPQDCFDGPQSGGDGIRFYRDYVVERRWNMRDLLRQTGAKFVFDTYWPLQSQALKDDRTFIALNYRACPASPLLIASGWQWLDPGRPTFKADIGGEFRTWTFSTGTAPILVDGSPTGGGAKLKLERGKHQLQTAAPGVLFTEFASPAIRSSDYDDVANAEGYAFKPIDADFSHDFRLLGLLRLKEKGADVYRLFWQETGSSDADLLAFHHFRDAAGNFVHGENVDPGDGWYSLRELGPGQYFSYEFKVPHSLRADRLDIGLYYRSNIASRIACGAQTFHTVDLSELR